MAPEQAVGDAVDHRADIYALGVVAYEMLAGRAPFDGRTAQQLLAAHAVEAPEPIARRRPNAPPALAALVMRLLEKNPADRPQSADEVLRALDAGSAATQEAERPGTPAHATQRRTATSAVASRRASALLPWALLAAAAVVIAVLATTRTSGSGDASLGPLALGITAPAGTVLRPGTGFARSPDGARLAFVADEQGRWRCGCAR